MNLSKYFKRTTSKVIGLHEGALVEAREMYKNTDSVDVSLMQEQLGIDCIAAAMIMDQLNEEGLFDEV